MGHVLHSRVSAADICDHIGNETRKNVVKAIKDSREKIGIMIDEATTNSLKSSLVVCLRFFLHGKPTSMFLDLIELEKSDSQTILDTLLECLKKHGMSDYLQEYLICFASDWASVMTGRASGIATKLKDMFPNVVIF